MSKFYLFSLMAKNDTAKIDLPDGRWGILQGMMRESGNGRCFNLLVLIDGKVESIFIRTID